MSTFIDFDIKFLDFPLILGGPWGTLGRHLAPSGHQVGAMGVIFCSLDRLCMAPGPTFGRHFSKSSIFLILIPLCSGICGFRGLAVQVGATWSISRRQEAPGAAKMEVGAAKRTPSQVSHVRSVLLCNASYGNLWKLPQIAATDLQLKSRRRSKSI